MMVNTISAFDAWKARAVGERQVKQRLGLATALTRQR
jgi:hypothetical protein